MDKTPVHKSEEEYLVSLHSSFRILAPKPGIVAAMLVIIALVSLLAVSTAYLKYQEIKSIYHSINLVPPIVTSTSHVDTSNWKTYRNDEYGFEFQYLPTYEIKIQDPTQFGGIGGAGYILDLNEGSPIKMLHLTADSFPRIRIIISSEDPSFLETLFGKVPTNVEQMNIGGAKAFKYEDPGCAIDSSGCSSIYRFAWNGKLFEFVFFAYGDSEYMKPLKPILSSFKFTPLQVSPE